MELTLCSCFSDCQNWGLQAVWLQGKESGEVQPGQWHLQEEEFSMRLADWDEGCILQWLVCPEYTRTPSNSIIRVRAVNNWSVSPQTTPPFYRIEDMTVPTALWSGGEDWVNPPAETQRLLPRITNIIHHEHFPDWNHFDHHWGQDAPQRMYRQVVALMEKNPWTFYVLSWDGEPICSHKLSGMSFMWSLPLSSSLLKNVSCHPIPHRFNGLNIIV